MITGLPICLPNIYPLYLSGIKCSQPCVSLATMMMLGLPASLIPLALLSTSLLLLITPMLLAQRLGWGAGRSSYY